MKERGREGEVWGGADLERKDLKIVGRPRDGTDPVSRLPAPRAPPASSSSTCFGPGPPSLSPPTTPPGLPGPSS